MSGPFREPSARRRKDRQKDRKTMSKRIYVGNLPYSATEDELRELFGQYGDVIGVDLVNDRETGRPRGFGFVEMGESEADEAIQKLNNFSMGGRSLRINEARPRRESFGGGGGGRGGGGRDRW